MEFHPIAALFPLLDDDDTDRLAADIGKHGLRNPVVLFEGKILDGRNRYHACLLAGVALRTTEFTGTRLDAIDFAWSTNRERRHLTSSQAAAAEIERERLVSEYAAELEKVKQEQRKRPQKSKATQVKPSSQLIDLIKQDNEKRTDAIRANSAGTNRQYVADARKIAEERPDLFEKVKGGGVTIPQAKKEMKRDEVLSTLSDIETIATKAIEGVFDAIVIDPPWQMKKIERECRPNQVEFDYPTMTEDELAELHIPSATDCHVWLWTTHKFLPMAFRLLDTWNLKYVFTMVWHKPGGFQPIGLAQYNCEFALYARKGSPCFVETKEFPTCFQAPRGRHSEKPGEFYDVVRRVTAGRRLDMFNRRPLDGFETWGKEAHA